MSNYCVVHLKLNIILYYFKKKKKERKETKPEPSGNSWESTVPQNLPQLMPGGWASVTA